MTTFELPKSLEQWLYISSAVGFVIPIITLIFAKMKKKVSIFPAFATGIVGYFFISSLKGVLEILIFRALNLVETENPSKSELFLRTTLDAIITAAVIWATLVFTYKFLLKNYKTKGAGISSAIGLAAINMFYFAFENFKVVSVIKSINSTGLEEAIKSTITDLEGEELDAKYKELYDQYVVDFSNIVKTPASKVIWLVAFMVVLFVIEICVGIIVFHSYHEKNTLGYVIVLGAYVVRCVCYGSINNQVISILINILIAAGLVYYALQTYQKSKIDEMITEEEQQPSFFSRKEMEAQKSLSSIMKQSSVIKGNYSSAQKEDEDSEEEIVETEEDVETDSVGEDVSQEAESEAANDEACEEDSAKQ